MDDNVLVQNEFRSQFPIFSSKVNGFDYAYLDNGATTQKPLNVINAISNFYSQDYATVHRGIYTKSQLATDSCDLVRERVARWLNASKTSEVIFVKGTTEAINLVAHSLIKPIIKEGMEILITALEHHANIVPWQLLAKETGAKLRIVPLLDDGNLDEDAFDRLLSKSTCLLAISHVSNVLGTILPVERLCEKARSFGAYTLIDGAQAIAHMKVDVAAIGCDCYCFSSHKMYGPTGVGCLYIRDASFDVKVPYQAGGDMIETVSFDETTFANLPLFFEAGTPPIAQIIGMGAAFDFLEDVGLEKIQAIEHTLTDYAKDQLSTVPDLVFIGEAVFRGSLHSFIIKDIHPHDIGTLLDQKGIAVRVGHHCAQPVMQHYGVPATVRSSYAIYNTKDEIDRLVQALHELRGIFL